MTDSEQPKCDECGKHCDVYEVVFPDGSRKLLCPDDYARARAQMHEAVLAALALFCGERMPKPEGVNLTSFEVSGPVLAANHFFAVLDCGGGKAMVLDRAEWPLEEGHAYGLKAMHDGRRLIEPRPVAPEVIRTKYGAAAGNIAAGWAARDKAMGIVSGKGHGRLD